MTTYLNGNNLPDANRNLLILTVYLIVVVYTLFQMILSLAEEVSIKLDKESLNSQLVVQNLQDIIAIQFRFERSFPLVQLRELAINIENKSPNRLIAVEWDACSLTDFSGRSRRVVRLPPGMMLDLSQKQVPSPINPNQTLKERITAEDILQRDADSGALKIAGVLLDIPKLKQGIPTERKRYNEFATGKADFDFTLQLRLRLLETNHSTHEPVFCTLACHFTIKKLTWIEALRAKPKIVAR